MKLKLKKWNRVWDEEGEYEDQWDDFGEHNVEVKERYSDEAGIVKIDDDIYSGMFGLKMEKDYIEFHCFSGGHGDLKHHQFRGYV